MHPVSVSTAEWNAWIAGFFDGEGTVMITHRKASRSGFSDNHQVWIGCAQRIDHRDVLDDIQATFGGAVRVLNRNKLNPKWSDIGQWELISRKDQRRFLNAMLPLLRVKRGQAQVALAFLDTVETYNRVPIHSSDGARLAGTNRLTDHQIAVRESFRQQIKLLNKVGPLAI